MERMTSLELVALPPMKHGVVVLCQLSYIREDCKANHRPVPRSPCGNLLKSGPPACRWCDPSIAWPAPMRRPDGNEKGPDPFGIRASTCDRVEGSALCASLARVHPILATDKRPHRPKGGKHERTAALHGQRALCDVALALHDELFGVEVDARRRTVKSLHRSVKRVRQSFLPRRVS